MADKKLSLINFPKESWLKNYTSLTKESPEVEKKEKTQGDKTFTLEYLSWTYAEKYLRENGLYDDVVVKYQYQKDLGIVEVLFLTKDGGNVVGYEFLPIMNWQLNAIALEKISQKDITNSYQRCFSKLVARLTGYGFNLYTNEDLIDDNTTTSKSNNPTKTMTSNTMEVNEKKPLKTNESLDDLFGADVEKTIDNKKVESFDTSMLNDESKVVGDTETPRQVKTSPKNTNDELTSLFEM